MTLLVSLYIHPGQEREFRLFEDQAARIMARYGGEIVVAFRPEGGEPYEVHLVRFPDRERFEAYRQDPELLSLAGLRERAIARTEILAGEEVEPSVG